MSEMLEDARFALRSFRNDAAFTLSVVLTLACGLGANAAVFTVVNAVLLEPLPYDEAERLVAVWEVRPDGGQTTIDPANYLDWRRLAASFVDIAAFNTWRPALTGDSDPERVTAALVTANFFEVLGVEPLLGGGFDVERATAGDDAVAMVSHALWRRRFGADPGLIGRTILVNDTPLEVVGVLPPGYRQPDISESKTTDLWRPLTLSPEGGRGSRYLSVVARLDAKASLSQAQDEMAAIAERLAAEFPDANEGYTTVVRSLRDELVGDTRRPLLLLLGAAGFLALVVCTNVANLLLARGQTRQQEVAIRAALGAGRSRLVRQVLVESTVLMTVAVVLGLIAVVSGTGALAALQARLFPAIGEVVVDARVIAFTCLLGAGTVLLFGLGPAIQVGRADLQPVLKEQSAAAGTTSSLRRARGALVVAEVALATVLLIATALLTRSYVKLQRVPTGFVADNVLTLQVSTPSRRYSDTAAVAGFYDALRREVASVPGVESVALVSDLIFTSANYWSSFTVEGAEPASASQTPRAEFRSISPGYFETMGIPLVAGRRFDEFDDGGAPARIVINWSLAERYLPAGDPIGMRLYAQGNTSNPPMTVIGVVADVLDDGLDSDPEPRFYQTYRQAPFRTMHVLVRSEAGPRGLVGPIRDVVTRLDPQMPVAAITTLDELVAESLSRRRFGLALLNAFTGLALALASIGIYGVVAYSVGQRRREIAVRTALGAERSTLVGMVLLESMRRVAVGATLGVAAAVVVGQLLSSLLYEVTAIDPVAFAVAPIALSAAAALATLLPARRAARIDPMAALRRG